MMRNLRLVVRPFLLVSRAPVKWNFVGPRPVAVGEAAQRHVAGASLAGSHALPRSGFDAAAALVLDPGLGFAKGEGGGRCLAVGVAHRGAGRPPTPRGDAAAGTPRREDRRVGA